MPQAGCKRGRTTGERLPHRLKGWKRRVTYAHSNDFSQRSRHPVRVAASSIVDHHFSAPGDPFSGLKVKLSEATSSRWPHHRRITLKKFRFKSPAIPNTTKRRRQLKDNRRFERKRHFELVKCKYNAILPDVRVPTVNISVNGMFIQTAERLPVGTNVVITFDSRPGNWRLLARVASHGNNGMGLEFPEGMPSAGDDPPFARSLPSN